MPLFLKWYNFVCEKLGKVVKQESTGKLKDWNYAELLSECNSAINFTIVHHWLWSPCEIQKIKNECYSEC